MMLHTTGNAFISPNPSDSRAPCPALNALANHGYIPRSGRAIPFLTLLRVIKHVYNFTLPLALLLCLGGYLTVGRFNWRTFSWEIDLNDLCEAGPGIIRIAHTASLVHENPQPDGAHNRLDPQPASSLFETLLENVPANRGMTVELLAKARAKRETQGQHFRLDYLDFRVEKRVWCPGKVQLSPTHAKIARGEAALVYATLSGNENHVPRERLIQWFGFSQGAAGSVGSFIGERLPIGWWEHVRPQQSVGLRGTKKLGSFIGDEVAKIKGEKV
jgi:hypothetical protein